MSEAFVAHFPTHVGKSFIHIRKRNGPGTETCETPTLSGNLDDVCFLKRFGTI